MFNLRSKKIKHAIAEVEALDRSQAVIEFGLDGTILDANENLLRMSGYTLAEIKGKHHSIFVSQAERESGRYRDFWASLNRGEFQTTQYKRFGKGGKQVWVLASYAPLRDENGKVVSFIKFATDITAQKIKDMEDAGKIAAINRVQAVIEFEMDGTIIDANENFLVTMGYSLDEIKGKRHGIFVTPEDRAGEAYAAFWAKLNRGEFEAAEFKRIGKGGREIWILASYNPILDENGKPFKVVKFATDITSQKMKAADSDGQLAAIQKSQAVIEFNMDGTIRTANENFQKTMGYTLAEIKGQHHSMFVEPNERNSADYRQFWETLRRGEYQAAEYKRIAKGGREVWIQGSYNPILDLNGRPYKVVKYATDITAQAIGRKKADNARGLIEAVAAGSEEMSASIREISETMAKSRENSKAATARVEAADGQAQKLNAAAQAMSGIVEMISGITGQINLLALNATIESARAGEAGRGFAVVASEVKNLASQAKQATDTISSEIDALNTVAGDVATSLTAIKAAIEGVNEFIATTAAAVEEQSAVTADMSTNMQRASAELA
ncbi:PAS domain-containing methyl-accepting chemotaxis protein [Bradyrhizobium sp. STM 3809]|uniref:methyl-accepting chemotaxis protein n=1 Tax=Bradyrhizobium sp. STM 3809 TaxID=551936 RepID=UPI000240A324|nr:PAS domain-containing methyl-accepting chemotaxis protein [Bradyrhizobium sp. STM 3809]CCE03502.1 Methyl-accepting chemotaxis sensory transducer with Pas/Pac sensor [Bradyrhizobium sp. STM 3809]